MIDIIRHIVRAHHRQGRNLEVIRRYLKMRYRVSTDLLVLRNMLHYNNDATGRIKGSK